jgi:allantoate deiminase
MGLTIPQLALRRLDALAAITDVPGTITRTFLSPAMAHATELVGGWVEAVGGDVCEDGWGNVIGHFPGTEAGAKTLLLGSHLDTVPNAGKFDGPLGVVVALAAMETLAERGVRLPFHVDVAGFSDEEGTRFHSAYLGSGALAGLLTETDLALRDEAGITVREAVARHQGVETVSPPAPRYAAGDLLGYIEVHLEQGPVLEQKGCALGVVDAIAAQTRLSCSVEGKAGHAGTTPMTMRRDALAGAAEIVLAVERLGRGTPGLVATVGALHVAPGASNVIPARVHFSVDLRHADDATLGQARLAFASEAASIAAARGLQFGSGIVQSSAAVACSPRWIEALERAIRPDQTDVPHLVSGAGHDGVTLTRIAPIGMIFVRCRDGLSHHPDEHVEVADIAAAIAALARFLEQFA